MPDWDKAYRDAGEPLFGDEPTDFVRAIASRADFAARSALCLADGDGRNGRWLAQQGLSVTAIDISQVATVQGRERDRTAGVMVHRIVADLATWSPPAEARWDALFVIFLQCPSAVRTAAISRGLAHLAIGGWVAVEGFARDRPAAAALGPTDPDLLYDADELAAVCTGLSVVESTVDRLRLREGSRHRGVGNLVHFIARKV